MPTKTAKAQPEKVEVAAIELENGNIQIPWIDGRIAEFRDMIGEDMERLEQFRIDYDGSVSATGLGYKMLSLLCVGIGTGDDGHDEGIEIETLRRLPARQFKAVMEVFAAVVKYFRLDDIFDDGSGDADASGDDDNSGSNPD